MMGEKLKINELLKGVRKNSLTDAAHENVEEVVYEFLFLTL